MARVTVLKDKTLYTPEVLKASDKEKFKMVVRDVLREVVCGGGYSLQEAYSRMKKNGYPRSIWAFYRFIERGTPNMANIVEMCEHIGIRGEEVLKEIVRRYSLLKHQERRQINKGA